ncbi:MAG: gluconokinase [Verrucomicrobiae bacterium]|nr:gluconokinase [Verrucomicrobiae bacterium]
MPVPQAIVLMGVCGCGKTEVGLQLARLTGGIYRDGDDYHSPENIAKMGRGEPLVDDDRWPWLARLHDEVVAPAVMENGGAPMILGCSALRKVYRDALVGSLEPGLVWFVHLSGDESLILERMRARKGHYMKEGMVASQLAILEEPGADECSITVSIEPAPDAIAREILVKLAGRHREPTSSPFSPTKR